MAFSSKKGVSPLIATILLIAFAVALGTVIMNWGLSLGSSSDDPCAKVALELKKMVDNGEVCYGNRGAEGYLNFVIENSGSTDISGGGLLAPRREKKGPGQPVHPAPRDIRQDRQRCHFRLQRHREPRSGAVHPPDNGERQGEGVHQAGGAAE